MTIKTAQKLRRPSLLHLEALSKASKGNHSKNVCMWNNSKRVWDWGCEVQQKAHFFFSCCSLRCLSFCCRTRGIWKKPTAVGSIFLSRATLEHPSELQEEPTLVLVWRRRVASQHQPNRFQQQNNRKVDGWVQWVISYWLWSKISGDIPSFSRGGYFVQLLSKILRLPTIQSGLCCLVAWLHKIRQLTANCFSLWAYKPPSLPKNTSFILFRVACPTWRPHVEPLLF